jgi:hypothetical protein
MVAVAGAAAALFSAKSGYIFLRPAKAAHGFQKHFAQIIPPSKLLPSASNFMSLFSA